MNRVGMLIHCGVTPYLVFDGDYLPSKAATEAERAKRREESKRLGLELHRMGKISQAHLELQKAIDVTPDMARQLIEELKHAGVQYVVAPYEADAQLAYLEKKGIIQGILSEDSDLLVFGAKRLLTKLDQYGECIEIDGGDFGKCREIDMVGWTRDDFRRMAILSGCDYLASINKMGLKTAHRMVRRHKTIEKILRMLQFDKQYFVPTGYLEAFRRAELTFLHQRVFCPIANDIVMATQLPRGMSAEELKFLGSHVEQNIALGIAKGDLHPMTKQPIVVKSNNLQPRRTIWTNSRRQTVGTPSDLKSNKSIDTFFKAQRTPLAELDPNSFNPSPSQQRLLYQANGTWASSPAPARPGLPRSSASVPASDSNSVARRTGLSSAAGSTSAPHPPKKRRLCSDTVDEEEAAHEANTAIQRSHFFGSSKPESSPCAKGPKSRAKTKNADFNIWSDDSVEDAMAELPDPPQKPSSPRREAIQAPKNGREEVGQALDSGIAAEDSRTQSQDSITSRSTLQTEVSTATSITSFAEPESGSLAKTLDTHVQLELTTLRKEYLYQPEPERCKGQRQEIIRFSTQPKERPGLQRSESMTPLQRLGATALNRSHSCNSLSNRQTGFQVEHRPEASKEQLPKLADILRSPTQPSTSAALATVVRGSEDVMIPDSETESEESQSENGPKGPKIDLGRFAFTG